METAHLLRGAVRFGVFEVDLAGRELRKRGVRVKLQDQPFQVLQILLRHPGDVVTREELREKIWPADTFVDFDQGLNNAIKRLRDALGDSAETPRFIETIPKHGYRFICTTELSSAPRQLRSLAVLPLENLSHDPEQEYFAEGLTEALITTLAKVGELRVISRTSVMQYKGVHKPLREIARDLEVEMVVEGTVLRAGRRVRITAQLIDAAKESHLWAESYERDLRNILALQSEVARAIAREVQIKLTPQEQAQFAQASPVDPESYEAYLKGRYHWNRRVVGGLEKAIGYFQEAISKDPTYGAAYAGLADCLSGLGVWGFVSPNEGCGKAKRLALNALEIDCGLAEAHASLAWATMWHDYDLFAAEREFERSIELNPRYATAHQWFGMSLGLMGRYEEGYTELKRAILLDPCSSVIHWTLGFVYRRARRYDQAIEQHERALELDPNFAQGHGGLGFDYLEKGMYEPAISELQKAVQLSQSAPTFLAWLGEAYAVAGHRDEALNVLERLQELSKQRYVTPYIVAGIYAALGKKEEALQWLNSAYGEHAAFMVLLKTEPRFDYLRSDPHFQDILRRMNFPE
jgi:TolB-like protein/Tfp pilus assembly protein PilF